MPTSASFYFSASFTLGTTNTLTIEDLVQSYGGVTTAILEVTDPDGIIFFQNTGYATDDHSLPDFNSATSTWATAAIDLPLDTEGTSAKRGTYTFNYKYKVSGTQYTGTKSYELDYVSPTVDIAHTVSCRTSELTIEDLTDYTDIGDSTPLTSALSRLETTTKPTGSSANDPGSTTTATSTYTRTIGGGGTSATRLWTKTWQTTVATTLTYTMEVWGAYTWIYIYDTVYGHTYTDVECSDCAASLEPCWENLVTRWQEAEANYSMNVNDLRYKVALCGALWTEFYNLERAGDDTSAKCLEIRDVLDSVDCSCASTSDTKSTVIVPWAAGSSSVSASTFAFTVSTSNPAGGNSGDIHYNKSTYHLWNNSGGTWNDVGSIRGTSGADGSDAQSSIVFSNSAGLGTSAGTSLELLHSVALASPIDFTTGDCIYVKGTYELYEDENGKTVSLYINNTKIVEYFTDTLVNSVNKYVTLEMWINITGTNIQTIETAVTRGGNVYPGYTTGTFDTSSTVTLKAYGQNSVATLNDIICRMFRVEYRKQITLV